MAGPPKEIRVNVRVAEELKARVMKIQEITGLDESTLVRKALESIVAYFDEHGEITVPFTVLPASALARQRKAKATKRAALPAGSGRSDAPRPSGNPSTASTRFSLNETPPQKSSGPRPRSTRGIQKISHPPKL